MWILPAELGGKWMVEAWQSSATVALCQLQPVCQHWAGLFTLLASLSLLYHTNGTVRRRVVQKRKWSISLCEQVTGLFTNSHTCPRVHTYLVAMHATGEIRRTGCTCTRSSSREKGAELLQFYFDNLDVTAVLTQVWRFVFNRFCNFNCFFPVWFVPVFFNICFSSHVFRFGRHFFDHRKQTNLITAEPPCKAESILDV